MFMRLGFSVAAHVDPDVLLVDEVLAVGDIAFQLKCIDRMRDLQKRGTTIVVVSHAMHAIRHLCPRTVLIRRGRLELDGPTETVISRHFELLSSAPGDGSTGTGASADDHTGKAVVTDQELLGPAGPTHHVDQDDVVTYRCTIRFTSPVASPHVLFNVITETGILAYSMVTAVGRRWRSFEAGDTVPVEVVFRPRLGGGTYRLGLVVTDRNSREVVGADEGGLLLYLSPRLGAAGVANLEATITVAGELLTDHAELLIGERGGAPAGRPD
jgi:hypothetical protein